LLAVAKKSVIELPVSHEMSWRGRYHLPNPRFWTKATKRIVHPFASGDALWVTKGHAQVTHRRRLDHFGDIRRPVFRGITRQNVSEGGAEVMVEPLAGGSATDRQDSR
jgi:hypothetical protein